MSATDFTKEYSLMDLKKALYGGEKPIITTTRAMKVSDFMETFFPTEFYLGTFTDAAGKPHSLRTMLSGSGQGPKSQRSKIFNRKYDSDKLQSEVIAILALRADLWTDICTNCHLQIANADLPRLESLLTAAAKGMRDKTFLHWVETILPDAPERALAAVLLCTLCQGNPSRYETIYSGGKPLREQLGYMDVSLTMMKRSFHSILSAQSFDGVKEMYENYAELLAPVTSISKNGSAVSYTHLLNSLYTFLIHPDPETASHKLIRITGPAGCEKNAITQLLFLRLYHSVRAMEEASSRFAPFYINLSHYRRVGLQTKEDLQNRLTADISGFLEFCKNNPLRKPILFVDGVKNYRYDGSETDYLLNSIIQRELPLCNLIVATENNVLPNKSRQRLTPFFATGDYICQVQISSLHLPEEARANEYLDKFQAIYAPNTTSFAIHSKLLEIYLEQIDTYQLRMVCPYLKEAKDIASLYETVTLNYLEGDTSELDAAAQWAFDFSYTDKPLPVISLKMMELLTAHLSFLQYFIARWMMKQITANTIGDLNILMPRGVGRFVTPMLSRSNSAEGSILMLAEENFDQLGVFARDEIAYRLGRLRSPNKALKADELLQKYYREQVALIDVFAAGSYLDYRKHLFLIRGLAVGLILKGHTNISEELLKRLMEDPISNEINRGFCLDYYGDRPYLPDEGVCFEDDITIGEHSLAYLLSSIEQGRKDVSLPPLFDLNLFSVCSMLQARTEEYVPTQNFDVVYYLGQAKKHLEWYLSQSFLKDPQLRYYFEMALRDFSQRLKTHPTKWSHISADTYDRYQTRIPRTGWVRRNIPEAESVAEHAYNMFLLGMLFLPETHPKEADYCKQTVLELVLMHDLAEAVTGDINKPDKQHDADYYRMQDEKEMGILFLRDTYPIMPTQTQRYNIWKLWHSGNYNALVAKDLDLIQTMYQLLTYRSRYPECINDQDFRRWMRERNDLKTELGVEIYRNVIQKNHRFTNQLLMLDKQP